MMFLKVEYFEAIALSIVLSFVTTVVLLIISLPLAFLLSYKKNRLNPVIEILVTLPLILPPSVIGFYLLLILNPNSFIGKFWFSITGQSLVFNFFGLVIGSVIYSLPFVVKPIQNAFACVPAQMLKISETLGAKPVDRFFSVILPCSKQGIVTGAVLGFTHTMGEFGVVLMLGGNIPGKTKTISISIFDAVEQLEYAQAHIMSIFLIIFSAITLGIIHILNGKGGSYFYGQIDAQNKF